MLPTLHPAESTNPRTASRILVCQAGVGGSASPARCIRASLPASMTVGTGRLTVRTSRDTGADVGKVVT